MIGYCDVLQSASGASLLPFVSISVHLITGNYH